MNNKYLARLSLPIMLFQRRGTVFAGFCFSLKKSCLESIVQVPPNVWQFAVTYGTGPLEGKKSGRKEVITLTKNSLNRCSAVQHSSDLQYCGRVWYDVSWTLSLKRARRRKSVEMCLLDLKGYISMVISKVVTRGWREGIKLL